MLRYALACCCAVALGCGTYTVTGSSRSPELAYVGPGVYAVTHYDYPVFYTDSYYWRYDSGRWYRSHRADGDWEYAPIPPASLRSHEQPERQATRDVLPPGTGPLPSRDYEHHPEAPPHEPDALEPQNGEREVDR
jgi:hypothetical protein